MNNEAPPIIEINSVTKRFGSVVTAVDNVSLEIKAGEFFALLGPSGCGKTTLLRMLAGFETPSEGQVRIAGTDMAGVPPNRRDVNMVFQSYAVFPHMTVAENVGYGLKVTGTPRAEIDARVEEALALVQLAGYGSRKPDQLSGGQRQRVALARALVKKPKVLLLDEPLSALDAKLREAMQLELVGLQHAVGITFVIVTHDQDEALSMADRIAVMDQGRVRQVAPPEELYEYPSSRFVADFIGKMNLFEGRASAAGGGGSEINVQGLGSVRLPHANNASGEIGIAVRPEKVKVSADRPPAEIVAFEAKLDTIAYHGSESHLFLTTDGGVRIAATLQNDSRAGSQFHAGERLWVSWTATDTLVLKE